MRFSSAGIVILVEKISVKIKKDTAKEHNPGSFIQYFITNWTGQNKNEYAAIFLNGTTFEVILSLNQFVF